VETETNPSGRNKDGRALAPVVTRVDTDSSQGYAWQKEASVRHVQESSAQSSAPYAGSSNQNTPPQQWQGHDLEQPSPYIHRNGTPDSQQNDSTRREYRNSGWGRPQNNGSVGVTGAG
jgi:hypothetical protein